MDPTKIRKMYQHFSPKLWIIEFDELFEFDGIIGQNLKFGDETISIANANDLYSKPKPVSFDKTLKLYWGAKA